MLVERRLVVSFSGGETSAYMTKWILENWQYSYDNIVVIFANTGQENEETLKFVEMCDVFFGFNVVWLESKVIHEKRIGTRHDIVDYESADRKGYRFEEMIKKYGIPNNNYPHCTRELKLQPINSYLKGIGWKSGSYDTAIGIRVDEIDRISVKKEQLRFKYPLVSDNPKTKLDINSWWEKQDFRLNLKGYEGNCKWCWKKTMRKHFTLVKENIQIYDFPMRMEKNYSFHGNSTDGSPRVFFRGGKSTTDILIDSLREFVSFHDDSRVYNSELDFTNGCSDSCDAFSDL